MNFSSKEVSSVVREGVSVAFLFSRLLIAPVDLRILLGHVLGMTYGQLVAHPERELDEEEAQRLSALVLRRIQGEPVAYLVGEREFFGLRFVVTEDVLIPRPETELLVEKSLAYLPVGGSLLDLGTGSGAIAVSVAHERKDVDVVATDVSEKALKLARENAERLLGDDRRVRFWCGDWFKALGEPYCFDVIVSNPPYIVRDDIHLSQGDLRFEPKGALTDEGDGLSAFRILVKGSLSWLREGGLILMEHGYDQAEPVRRLLKDAGFVAIQSFCDLAGIERVSGGRMPRSNV